MYNVVKYLQNSNPSCETIHNQILNSDKSTCQRGTCTSKLYIDQYFVVKSAAVGAEMFITVIN